MIVTVRERLHSINAEKLAEQNRPKNSAVFLAEEMTLEIPDEIALAIASDISADIYDDIDYLIWLASFDDGLSYAEYDALYNA